MRHPDGLPAWDPPDLPHIGYLGPCRDRERARAGEDWLRARGCTLVRAPVEGATWHTYRVNQGPFDRPLFLGEPPTTEDPWPAWGYRPRARYASTLVPHDLAISKARAVAAAREPEGWRLQSLAELGDTEAALALLHALSHAAFAEAFSFTPLSREAFDAIYRPYVGLVDPELVLFARAPDGRAAGFGFTFPDPGAPERRELVVKTIAVHPDFRRLGLGNWLTGEAQARGRARGLDGGGIHALMWTGSQSVNFGGDQGRPFRRYVLYEKALTAPEDSTGASSS